MNERLVKGQEDLYLSGQFATKAVKKLPDYAVRYHIGTLAADAHQRKRFIVEPFEATTTLLQQDPALRGGGKAADGSQGAVSGVAGE